MSAYAWSSASPHFSWLHTEDTSVGRRGTPCLATKLFSAGGLPGWSVSCFNLLVAVSRRGEPGEQGAGGPGRSERTSPGGTTAPCRQGRGSAGIGQVEPQHLLRSWAWG